MAQANPIADVRAANGLVGTTSSPNRRSSFFAAACLEAQNEGFVVVAVEDDVSNDGFRTLTRRSGNIPPLVLVVTFS